MDNYRPGLLPSLSCNVFSSLLFYPIYRMQNLVQTQIGYSTINPSLKVSNFRDALKQVQSVSGGMFRGASFACGFTGVKNVINYTFSDNIVRKDASDAGMFFSGIFMSLIGSGLAYPFEFLSLKASCSANSVQGDSVLKFKDYLKPTLYTNVTHWTGFNLLFTRNVFFSIIFYCQVNGLPAIFSLAAAFATIPIETVRKNLMISQWESNYGLRSIKDVTNHIISNHGSKGFFRGAYLFPDIFVMVLIGRIAASLIREKGKTKETDAKH